MTEKYVWITLIFIILLFAVFVVLGVTRNASEVNSIKDNCELTDFYGIGNKGNPLRIYDCSGGIND